MAVGRYIGSLDAIPARREPATTPPGRVASDGRIELRVSGLIDGNSDVLVYLTGLSLAARLTRTQARRLAGLLYSRAESPGHRTTCRTGIQRVTGARTAQSQVLM